MPKCTCTQKPSVNKYPNKQDCPALYPQGSYFIVECKKFQPYSKDQLIKRLKQYQDISGYLRAILDVTELITQIMRISCVNKCKCMKALDYLIYAFLHFDEKRRRKKELRKKELSKDLIEKCFMTGDEAKTTIEITQAFFHAFYYKQLIRSFNIGYINKCIWKIAGQSIINNFKERDITEGRSSDASEYSIKVFNGIDNYLENRQQDYLNSLEKVL